MASAKVFIILLNWNNWHETKQCLESLEKVNYPNFEVIIVDNGSAAEERKKIGSFHTTYYILHTTYNNANLGFAGGNNVGIQYALEQGTNYVMLLNNDTVVASDFLAELVRVGESNASYGILGSRIYRHGTSEVIFDGGKINKWLTKGMHKLTGSDPVSFVVRRPQHIKKVDYITGAAMLVRREVIEKMASMGSAQGGLMREEYFLYYEDVDWCLRARRGGYKCVVVPTSKVWHKVSATTKEGSPSYIYYHTRNSLTLAKFNGNILQKIAAYAIGLWILLKQVVKFFLLPSKRVWAKAMTRGVLDFYTGKYGKYENRD